MSNGGLTDRVCERVRGWWVAVSGAVFIGFFAFVLPAQAASSAKYAGDVGSPDTRFWYDADYLRTAAEAYGPDGRAAYVNARLQFDVVWPLAYWAFFTAALGWLLATTTPAGSNWRRLVWLPTAAMLLDFAENLCTAVTIGRYPDSTWLLPTLAGPLTAGKWISITAALLAVLWLTGRWFWQRRRGQPARSAGSATMPS